MILVHKMNFVLLFLNFYVPFDIFFYLVIITNLLDNMHGVAFQISKIYMNSFIYIHTYVRNSSKII